ncbi:MAG: mobilization protein [Parafilimonas sp.]
METINQENSANESAKRKGGRPVKAVKRKKTLTIKCTSVEEVLIKAKAKQGGITVSEYLRTLGVSGKVVMLVKTIPAEHLAFIAALNHLGALLNQIAKKRNSNDELNALERAGLKTLEERIKVIVFSIEKRNI